ncbi:MAG: hypothetical protein HC915_15415 [Anaerolineae bacterium]|nr:hypothetical protein [Anaerolineae bacterium]
MILLDAERRELARGDTPRVPTIASIPAYSLPVDGVYYLMVTREGFSEGTTEGTYRLSLAGRPGLSGTNGLLEVFYEVPISGMIDAARPFESYIFAGSAGEVVTIELRRLSGDLDPLVTLFEGNKQIAFDDGSRGSNVALIEAFRLPADGIYRVEASRLDRVLGTSSGSFSLLITRR